MSDFHSDMIASCSGYRFVSRCPSCVEKNIFTPLVGSMLSHCLDQILTLPQKKSRLIRAVFLLSSFGGPLLTAASVSCCYLTGVVRSSAAVVLLLQGLTCCAITIRDALLQNSVVTSCYLCSYQIKTVWLFSSDLNIFTQELTLFSIFLDHYR